MGERKHHNHLIDINSCQVEAGSVQPTSPKIEKPEFALDWTLVPHIFILNQIDWLPFQLNIGKEANLTWEQQSHFINVVYDTKVIFLLLDEGLGYCDQIKHTIPTMTDNAVFLPHHTIPRQLQGEVCKCLDTWLHQGII